MRNRKQEIKALALATVAAVLGTMALATGAQAQLPGESQAGSFLVNLGFALLATITGQALGFIYLLALNSLNAEIRCSGLSFEEAKINNSTDASGLATFSGCKMFSMHPLFELPCQFKTLETIKISFLAKPILHGGLTYVLFEPLIAGGTFTTISIKAGTECVHPLNSPVTGSFTALVEELDAVTQTLLFSPTIQLLTGDVLKIGLNAAYIDGTVHVSLTGSHAGQKLGIH